MSGALLAVPADSPPFPQTYAPFSADYPPPSFQVSGALLAVATHRGDEHNAALLRAM